MTLMLHERVPHRGGVVPVDHRYLKPRSSQLCRDNLRRLLGTHRIGLPVSVAVEDRADGVQPVVDDEVYRFPHLPLAALAVTDDAEYALVRAVQPRSGRETRGDGQALSQRARSRREEGESLRRIRVAVDLAVDGPKPHGVVNRHGSALFGVSPHGQAQLGAGSVHDGAGVPLREHESVGRRTRRVGGVISHVPVHQCGHDVRQAGRRGRVARVRRRRHLDGQPA